MLTFRSRWGSSASPAPSSRLLTGVTVTSKVNRNHGVAHRQVAGNLEAEGRAPTATLSGIPITLAGSKVTNSYSLVCNIQFFSARSLPPLSVASVRGLTRIVPIWALAGIVGIDH